MKIHRVVYSVRMCICLSTDCVYIYIYTHTLYIYFYTILCMYIYRGICNMHIKYMDGSTFKCNVPDVASSSSQLELVAMHTKLRLARGWG